MMYHFLKFSTICDLGVKHLSIQKEAGEKREKKEGKKKSTIPL